MAKRRMLAVDNARAAKALIEEFGAARAIEIAESLAGPRQSITFRAPPAKRAEWQARADKRGVTLGRWLEMAADAFDAG